MEGVKRYRVRLLFHNPDWSHEFDTVKVILSCLYIKCANKRACEFSTDPFHALILLSLM